jgi:tRNA-splicing endonuclease subunit Sen34
MLTGTLPHVAQQNVFLGVPILLMPEEVVLLVEKRAPLNANLCNMANYSLLQSSQS